MDNEKEIELRRMKAELDTLKQERMREEIRTTETRLQIEANFREHVSKGIESTENIVRDLFHIIERFVESRTKIPQYLEETLKDVDAMKTQITEMAESVTAIKGSVDEALKLKERMIPTWLRNVLVAAGVAIIGATPIVLGELLKYSHLSQHLDKIMPWLDRMATVDWQKLVDMLEKLVK